jgi:SAM-dependent methyltransferase
MSDFWQRPDIVEQFASRDPDHRLVAWCEAQSVQGLRVLDLGCAGGRNTVYLVAQGAEVYALDASPAMVAKTRARLTDMAVCEVHERVIEGSMTDLGCFANDMFEWVIALGVYHTATSFDAWQHAIAETARVLKPDGALLLSQFAPGSHVASHVAGKPWQPVAGQAHLFANAGRYYVLLTAADIDRYLGQYGLLPVVDTYTVKATRGDRFSVNGYYRLEADV